MRRSEKTLPEMEFPTRYAVEEARFVQGQDAIRNQKEVMIHE